MIDNFVLEARGSKTRVKARTHAATRRRGVRTSGDGWRGALPNYGGVGQRPGKV